MARENSGLMADIMCEVFSDSLNALISVQFNTASVSV